MATTNPFADYIDGLGEELGDFVDGLPVDDDAEQDARARSALAAMQDAERPCVRIIGLSGKAEPAYGVYYPEDGEPLAVSADQSAVLLFQRVARRFSQHPYDNELTPRKVAQTSAAMAIAALAAAGYTCAVKADNWVGVATIAASVAAASIQMRRLTPAMLAAYMGLGKQDG